MCSPSAEWAYVGFGANLGPTEDTFAQLCHDLHHHPDILALKPSPLYHTAPVGGPPQPDFLNAVLALHTALAPLALLELLLQLEDQYGRVRELRWGPRRIDLDLLLMGGQLLDVSGPPALQLPHPRLHLRRFVLQPLADLAPDLVHPGLGLSVAALLEACPDRSPVLPYRSH